jgi:hypothetical protein
MKSNNILILFLWMPFFNMQAFEKVHYLFSNDPIDVVIPCHPKDAANLERAIAGVKQYVQGLRRVMVISSERITDQAEWIDERIFPFNKDSIALEIFKSREIAYHQIHKPQSRMGWIYQQFLKFYAPFCIPNISSNVLIVDSDVVFLNPVSFLRNDGPNFDKGAGLYAYSIEFHPPYFQHAARLLPGLKKVFPNYSGIAHHMLFQKPVLVDFFNLIEKEHNVEPWKALARSIPMTDGEISYSAMSEYEIYFNFVFSRTDQVKIRHLHWGNREVARGNVYQSDIDNYKNQGYAYVAIHIWDL